LIRFKGQRIAPKASFTDRSRRCAGKSSVYDRRIEFPTSVAAAVSAAMLFVRMLKCLRRTTSRT
jgi:hypothetical protein